MVQEAGAYAEDHGDQDKGEHNADPHLVHELVVLQLLLQLIHAAAVQHHTVSAKVVIHGQFAGILCDRFVELVMLQLYRVEDGGSNLLQKIAIGQRIQCADRGC